MTLINNKHELEKTAQVTSGIMEAVRLGLNAGNQSPPIQTNFPQKSYHSPD